MNNEGFRKALEPVRAKLAAIDKLLASQGAYFNEEAQEKAKVLVDELWKETPNACTNAELALEPQQEEVELTEDDEDVREPQEGDVYDIVDGKPVRRIPESERVAESVPQGDNLAPHSNPITASAIASIEDGLERARVKDGSAGAGIVTAEVGKSEKTVELATSEGAEQTHFVDDSSKVVLEPGEAAKVVDGDKHGEAALAALQAEEGEGAKHTTAIDADKAPDEAALEAGRQAVILKPVEQPEPGDAGALKLNPEAQGSGSERYEQPSGSDWTSVGMTASGEPCEKGSAEDVTSR